MTRPGAKIAAGPAAGGRPDAGSPRPVGPLRPLAAGKISAGRLPGPGPAGVGPRPGPAPGL